MRAAQNQLLRIDEGEDCAARQRLELCQLVSEAQDRETASGAAATVIAQQVTNVMSCGA